MRDFKLKRQNFFMSIEDFHLKSHTCKCRYSICICILCDMSYIHATGIVRRICTMDYLWEEFIECFREDTSMLFDQVIFNLKVIVKCPRLNVLLGC